MACRFTLHNDYVELAGAQGAYLLGDLLLVLAVRVRARMFACVRACMCVGGGRHSCRAHGARRGVHLRADDASVVATAHSHDIGLGS